MDSAVANKVQEPIELIEQLLAARFSCRAFLPKPVPRATIERILVAAQKTASWCNSQPWRLEIASGEATRKFREVMYGAASTGRASSGDFPFPREYRGVYLQRRRESGFQLYNSLGIPRGDKAGYAKQALENFNFFGAPHVAIVHTDEALGVYGAIDCGGYLMSFMLAAQALGVATIPQAALAFHSEVVRRHFGLGDDRRVVCGISFGYPDREHKANSYRTSRAKLADAVTFVDE
jgi:nitroreductase